MTTGNRGNDTDFRKNLRLFNLCLLFSMHKPLFNVFTMCARDDKIETVLLFNNFSMANINIRIDQKLKKAANEVLSNVGLDMSSAVKLFLTQMVIAKKIPFRVLTVNGFTPEFEEELLKDIAEAEEEVRSGKRKPYDNVHQMFEDILNEPDDEV